MECKSACETFQMFQRWQMESESSEDEMGTAECVD